MATPPTVNIDGEEAFAMIRGFFGQDIASSWASGVPNSSAPLQSINCVVRKLPFHIGRVIAPLDENGVAVRSDDPCAWLTVANTQVSRAHATIDWDVALGQYTVTCLGKNGGHVNDKVISLNEKVPLRSQCAVRFGAFYFYFLLPAGQATAPKQRAVRPAVPWKDVIRRVVSRHLSSLGYFTVLDLARLAPTEFPDPGSLPEDSGAMREAMLRQLKNTATLIDLGLELVDAAAVPPAVLAVLTKHHTHKQKLWFRIRQPGSGGVAPNAELPMEGSHALSAYPSTGMGIRADSAPDNTAGAVEDLVEYEEPEVL